MSKRDIISKNILSLRKKAGYTQAELADKLNYSDKAISKWERGESLPDAEMLYNIATLFGVEIGYLFEEHNNVELPQDVEKELHAREMKARWIFAVVLALLVVTIVALGIFSLWQINKLPTSMIWIVFVSPLIPSIVLITEIITGRKVLFPLVVSITMWTYVITVLAIINRGDPKPGWNWLILLGLVFQIAIIIYPRVLEGVRNPKEKNIKKENKGC